MAAERTTYKVRYLHAASDSYRTGYEGEDLDMALDNARDWREFDGIGDVHIVETSVRVFNVLDVGWTPRRGPNP
jgi:hypothetical protein